MNNLEWLRTLDASSLSELMRTSSCYTCAFSEDGRCLKSDVTCADGIKEWLGQEHEEPDSWERIEADATYQMVEYWRCERFECDNCPSKNVGRKPYERYGTSDCGVAQRIELVRRCKALAEKERGEL